MDEEIKRTLDNLAEGMRQLGEAFGTQTKYYNEQYEKDKKFSGWREDDRKAQKDARKEIREAEVKHLGYVRDELGVLKQATDLRKIENQERQNAINLVRRQVDEDKFRQDMQQRYLSDQLAALNKSTDAYGGMVRGIIDLNAAQREELLTARRKNEEDNKAIERAERLAKTTYDLSMAKDGEYKALKKKNEAEEKNIARMEKAAKAIEKPGDAIKGYTTEHGKQLDSLNSIIGAGKDSLYDMAKGSKLATVGLVAVEAVSQLVASAFMGAVKAAISMGKELLNGQRGMAVGASGVKTFTQELNKGVQAFGTLLISVGSAAVAIGLLGGPIGWFGMAIGAGAVAIGAVAKVAGNAAETLAELNEIAAQLNDKLFAGFNELGKMSMTASGGMEDIADKLHKMGMTVAEFDKFKAVVAANSKEMKMFGTTMADGLTKFTDVTANLYESESSKMFQRMGITLEEQYEHTAKYMALQARLGTLQEKNAKELEKGTKSYIEELDKIATLTGATRKEQETAREAVMKIEQLRAALLDEQRKKEAGDTTADARIAKLQRGLDIATTYQQMGDASAAKGAAEYTAAGGITSEDSAKFRIMAQNKGLLEALNKGGKSKEEMDIMTREGYIEQTKKVASATRLGANVGPLGGSAVIAGDQQAILATLKEREEAEKKRLGPDYNRQEFIDRLTKEREAKGGAAAKNVDINRTNTETAIKIDTAALKFSNSVDINKKAIDAFAKTVDKFEEYFRGKKPSDDKSGGKKFTKEQAAQETAKLDAEIERFKKNNNMQYKANQAYVENLNNKKAGIAANTQGGSASPSSDGVASSAQSLSDAGLKLRKTGDVQKEGAVIDPKLIELAKKVQGLPGFQHFTGFNDVHHNEKAPNSTHTKGRAFDFVFDRAPSKEEGAKLVAAIKEMGADYVQDEYNFPSAESTGNHFHAQLNGARTGGIFDGPSSGYPVMLHGKEAVVPQANFKDIKKETLGSQSVMASTGQDEVVGLLSEMVETLSDKLDEVINKLGDGNDIQGKILNYSMA